MKISETKSGAVIPSVMAGVIYFIIAIATGASAAAAILGGVLIAIVAGAITLAFRSVHKHRTAGFHH